MRSWRTIHESQWEESEVEVFGQTANRLGCDATRSRGVRGVSARGAQSSALLQVEEAAIGCCQPHLRGQDLQTELTGTAARGRDVAAQECDRGNHSRESGPKKRALGLEDHGQLPAELQKRVHEEVNQTRQRSGWFVKRILALKQALEKNAASHEQRKMRSRSIAAPGQPFPASTSQLFCFIDPAPLFCSMANTDRGIRTPTSGKQP
jgi:hypothetical protein